MEYSDELLSAYLLVLKQGAKIELADDYWMSGDPSNYYISYGHPYSSQSQGLYLLDTEGLNLVLKEIDQMRQDDKDNNDEEE